MISPTNHRSRVRLGIPAGRAGLCALATVAAIGTGSAQSTWTPRNSGTVEILSGIAFGNSRWVSVGENGKIISSPDSISWAAAASGTTAHLRAVAYGAGKFVAVGFGGTIVTSPDGLSWTPRSSGTSVFLSGITFGDGRFIAVGAAGAGDRIVTSPDGIGWSPAPIMVSGALQTVHFSNGVYVAAGTDAQASRKIYRSTDGTTWTPTTPAVPAATVYAGSTFFAGRYYTCGLFGAIASGGGRHLLARRTAAGQADDRQVFERHPQRRQATVHREGAERCRQNNDVADDEKHSTSCQALRLPTRARISFTAIVTGCPSTANRF